MSGSFATSWTTAHQAPLSMGFPRQKCWSGLPFPPPGNPPDTGMEPISPALAGGFFTTELPGKPHKANTLTNRPEQRWKSRKFRLPRNGQCSPEECQAKKQEGNRHGRSWSERGDGGWGGVSDTDYKTFPWENRVSWELTLFRCMERHLAKSRASDTFRICLPNDFISPGVKEVVDKLF